MVMRPTIEMIQLKLHYVIPRSSDCQIFNNYFFSVLEAPQPERLERRGLLIMKLKVRCRLVWSPCHDIENIRQGNNQERTLTLLSTDVTSLGGLLAQCRQEIHMRERQGGREGGLHAISEHHHRLPPGHPSHHSPGPDQPVGCCCRTVWYHQ